MLIDVETYEYFSVHSAGSEGVLVLIQHYRDIPLMRKESFVLSPGSMNDMKIAVYLLYQLFTQGGKGSSEGKEVQPILLHDYAFGI